MRQARRPFLFLHILITLILISILAPASYAQPGSTSDPIITKSYLDNYLRNIFSPQREQLSQLERQLKEIEAKVEQLKSLEPPFSDIEKHWARENITFLYYKGVTTGFSDGTYKPNETVTRAQLAAMLVRAKGITRISAGSTSPFKDINGHWAQVDILTAREAGIIGGYPDGTFKPNQQVSRAEIAAMLDRAFGLQGDRPPMPFNDVAASHWAKLHIDALGKAGITEGYSDLTFRPANQATRAEVATFISRALEPRFR